MAYHALAGLPGVTLEVAADFTAAGVWVDITTQVRGFSTSIAKALEAVHISWPPGPAEITLDNRTGNFTPEETASDYYPNIVPGIHVRIVTVYGGTTFPVWYGIVEDWNASYPYAKDGVAHARLVQSSVLLTRWESPVLFDPAGNDGEPWGDRVQNVIDRSYPLGWVHTADAAQLRLQGSDYSGTGMDMLADAARAEGGCFYCDADGVIQWLGRHALVERSETATSQRTFGMGGGSEIPYLAEYAPEIASDMSLLVNRAIRQNVGGVEYTADDATSIAFYGSTFSDTDTSVIGTDDGFTAALADRLVHWRKDLYAFPRSITYRPAKAPSIGWPSLALEPFWRITVKVPSPFGYTRSWNCLIIGIHHEVTPGDWVVTLDLEPAGQFDDVISFFTLSVSQLDGTHVLAW